MTTTVGRTYRFRAVHSLPDFPEPWCYPHEHDYTVHIEAVGGTPTDKLDEEWAEANVPLSKLGTVEAIAESLLTFIEAATAVTVWEDYARWGKAQR